MNVIIKVSMGISVVAAIVLYGNVPEISVLLNGIRME